MSSKKAVSWIRLEDRITNHGGQRRFAFLLSLRSLAGSAAAAFPERRAARADSDHQHRVLGAIPAWTEGAAFYRRADDDSSGVARRCVRYSELDLAGVRATRRHLAHDRDVRRARRETLVHD